MELREKIVSREANIGIMGLGYVGLPLALAFADAGFWVSGHDTDKGKIRQLNSGVSYVADIPSKRLKEIMSTGRFKPLDKLPMVWAADVVVICVPTPVTADKKPDVSYIESAARSVQNRVRSRDVLVVLESSTYPGTTKNLVAEILPTKYVAYSPERIDPGNKRYSLGNTPKLVSGVGKKSLELAELLYSQIAEKMIPVSSPEVAEMTKLLENTYRNVNIALVNEVAILCEKLGISVWEVIEAASTKPFGYAPFWPSIGVGGHCIPVDPYYLLKEAAEFKVRLPLTETAVNINERMPAHTANQIARFLKREGKEISEAKLLVLGIGFKKDINDIRESPSVRLMEILRDMGADVRYSDPFVRSVRVGRDTLKSQRLIRPLLEFVDCTVIATDHTEYNYKLIAGLSNLVFDARGATKHLNASNIVRLGESL